jgi:hypothetical protein
MTYNPLNRQMDFMISTQSSYLDLPNNIKGKLTANDFLYFNWDSSFEFLKKNYQVVLETLSYQDQDLFRSIGALEKKVKLPLTIFANDALVLLLPNNPSYPVYIGTLVRGKTYFISPTRKYKNYYLLQ